MREIGEKLKKKQILRRYVSFVNLLLAIKMISMVDMLLAIKMISMIEILNCKGLQNSANLSLWIRCTYDTLGFRQFCKQVIIYLEALGSVLGFCSPKMYQLFADMLVNSLESNKSEVLKQPGSPTVKPCLNMWPGILKSSISGRVVQEDPNMTHGVLYERLGRPVFGLDMYAYVRRSGNNSMPLSDSEMLSSLAKLPTASAMFATKPTSV
ncbi:hypothetical protein VNO77_03200 [Canavalia gladiata]|uniref:Uncharacterized protein n=1 Tax=Canavalia gladiata TaxID=3824 RepID=A0AAN9MUB8_CANGL